jgi:hypothetical protein
MNDWQTQWNKERTEQDRITYDLHQAILYNGTYETPKLTSDDIERVLALVEGENDGAHWHWIVELRGYGPNEEKYAHIDGWCDYTGWDCQSAIAVDYARTAIEACTKSGSFSGELLRQLSGGRAETWRESKNRELGV